MTKVDIFLALFAFTATSVFFCLVGWGLGAFITMSGDPSLWPPAIRAMIGIPLAYGGIMLAKIIIDYLADA